MVEIEPQGHVDSVDSVPSLGDSNRHRNRVGSSVRPIIRGIHQQYTIRVAGDAAIALEIVKVQLAELSLRISESTSIGDPSGR